MGKTYKKYSGEGSFKKLKAKEHRAKRKFVKECLKDCTDFEELDCEVVEFNGEFVQESA
jgi:hypothetical protein